MVSLKNILTSAAALMALVQVCPASYVRAAEKFAGLVGSKVGGKGGASKGLPPGGIATAVGMISSAGTVDGDVLQAHTNASTAQGGTSSSQGTRRGLEVLRREEAAAQAYTVCKDQLGNANMVFSAPVTGNIIVHGIPPKCMNAVPSWIDESVSGAPIPIGEDAILFQHLSDDDIKEIQDALNKHPSRS
ncbi:hypothetical protein GGR53DRAFT_344713 [Hypoxylon sp. FL1150]|nr:hypothetical protein GGR53DRAFT_344713 [Hypoxylon sp. FL1150]